jgi:hypothetical protein
MAPRTPCATTLSCGVRRLEVGAPEIALGQRARGVMAALPVPAGHLGKVAMEGKTRWGESSSKRKAVKSEFKLRWTHDGHRLSADEPGLVSAGAGRVRAGGDLLHGESPAQSRDWRQGPAGGGAGGHGRLAVAEGQAARTTRLGGAAAALWKALGAAIHPVLRGSPDQAVQTMQAALGEAAFTAAWAEGSALPLDDVVALAPEDTHGAVGALGRPGPSPAGEDTCCIANPILSCQYGPSSKRT